MVELQVFIDITFGFMTKRLKSIQRKSLLVQILSFFTYLTTCPKNGERTKRNLVTTRRRERDFST